jgi:hypothetical protein
LGSFGNEHVIGFFAAEYGAARSGNGAGAVGVDEGCRVVRTVVRSVAAFLLSRVVVISFPD